MEISMENSKEKCPDCGKKVKFLKKHQKKMHSSREIPGNIPGKFQENSKENSKENPTGNSNNFFKEINLKGEFDKMAETINPKKEEAKFKCGACGGEFNERHKRCPHCGVEFQ